MLLLLLRVVRRIPWQGSASKAYLFSNQPRGEPSFTRVLVYRSFSIVRVLTLLFSCHVASSYITIVITASTIDFTAPV